jgi:hypothetical protein
VRILLDECLPAELADELAGHEARTVQIERTQQLPADLSVVTLMARINRIESLRPLVPKLLRVLRTSAPAHSCVSAPDDPLREVLRWS